ncbi:transposable element Tc3 transposase [Trichonephila clavipes]|nr:transposable element Tc3 transposase [Trichonephila clavipes]
MDDSVRPPRANIVDECLQSEDITLMDWPAYSPDLNPIEHVWDMLGRRTATRQPPPICLPELRRALLDEWCNILQDQIDNLILSMPRHYPNFTSERVIQPSSLGAERAGNRGILDESTFSEGVCVQTHKLHRGDFLKESQGVGDLFTATSYVKSKIRFTCNRDLFH